MKIEPMTVDEIKGTVAWHNKINHPNDAKGHVPRESCNDCRIILAWAHERARGNMFKRHLMWVSTGTRGADPRAEWDAADWLNEVLDEINWPKDER